MTLNRVIVEVAALKLAFTAFVECWFCNVHVAPCESIRPTIVPRVSSRAVTSIIRVICWWITLHYLLVVIVGGYYLIRLFSVPLLVWGVKVVPTDVVGLFDLDIDGAVLASWSSEDVGFLILRYWISLIDCEDFSDALSSACLLIEIRVLVFGWSLLVLIISGFLCLVGFANVSWEYRLEVSFTFKLLSTLSMHVI